MTAWHDPLSKKHQARKRDGEPAKPNKYKAQRTALGFPSKLEESVYADLLYLEKAGKLTDVNRYASVKLTPRVTWKCDFKVFDKTLNRPVWVEAKGIETERYRIIKQLWPDFGPGLLRIYKGSASRVWIDEEIEGGLR